MGVEDTYDTVAATYAARFTDELARKPYDAALLSSIAARCMGGVVVDVGCGPGHIGAAVGAVAGLDLSHEMLRLATLPLRVRADVRAAPFATGSIDGAVAFYSLIHLESIDGALCELHRVLRPSGLLCISGHAGSGRTHLDEWFGHAVDIDGWSWSLDDVVASVSRSGFTVETATVRPPYDGESTHRIYVTAVA